MYGKCSVSAGSLGSGKVRAFNEIGCPCQVETATGQINTRATTPSSGVEEEADLDESAGRVAQDALLCGYLSSALGNQ